MWRGAGGAGWPYVSTGHYTPQPQLPIGGGRGMRTFDRAKIKTHPPPFSRGKVEEDVGSGRKGRSVDPDTTYSLLPVGGGGDVMPRCSQRSVDPGTTYSLLPVGGGGDVMSRCGRRSVLGRGVLPVVSERRNMISDEGVRDLHEREVYLFEGREP